MKSIFEGFSITECKRLHLLNKCNKPDVCEKKCGFLQIDLSGLMLWLIPQPSFVGKHFNTQMYNVAC